MTNTKNSFAIWDWALVRIILGLSIVLFAGFFTVGGFTEESTRMGIRWSAKISAFCFCIAFGASAFHQWIQSSFSFWLFRNRKYWGISFAIVHLIHFAFLLLLQQQFHPVFTLAKQTSLFAGGMAYLFLVLMLLTSFSTFSKHLSKKSWKVLHTIGGYWIWGIFINSNLKNAMTKPDYIPLTLLLASVLILRIIQIYKRKAIFNF